MPEKNFAFKVIDVAADRQRPTPMETHVANSKCGEGNPRTTGDFIEFAPTVKPASKAGSRVVESSCAPKPQRRRSSPIWAACSQCQKTKIKCSGERPTCSSCCRRGFTCEWDVREGLTRHADMKQRMSACTQRQMELEGLLAQTKDRLDVLTRFVNALRSGSDSESALDLAKLRLGIAIEDILHDQDSRLSISRPT